MKKFLKTNYIFLFIILLAAVLRLWNLGNFPAGFNADEAALGYNAYSLLQTGKDEYGTAFPLVFKSFGDYKPGLYAYFDIPFILTLGLSEVAVRLPSALFGIGTVILIYFLGRKIFGNIKVGLIAAFLLAISPWHLHFSRGAWETNVATFFISLGVLLFLKIGENGKWLILSFLAFLTSMYVYQSPRLVVPALVVALLFLYKKEIFIIPRKFLIYLPVLFIIAIPLLLQFTSGAGGARFSGLSFLSDIGPVNRVNELRGEHSLNGGVETKLLHNKITAFGPEFLRHYLDHFSGDFLFINGDPLIRNKVPEVGQFYLIESLLLLAGIFVLIAKRTSIKHAKIILVWIIVAPLASSMTYQTPHALRALNMVVPLTLVLAAGFWCLLSQLKGYLKYFIIGIFAIALMFEFIHYMESYYNHYPKRYPLSWEYGFKEMVSKLENYESQYKKVVITDRYDQPYILLLFFKRYDPQKYQPQAVLSPRDKFNFGTIRSFDNYEFRPINPEEIKNSSNTLFIGTEKEVSPDANIVDKVLFPDGSPAFVFVKT